MELPTKDKKFEQHNFSQKSEATEWLQRNRFKSKGYLTQEPWASFFIEQWEKDDLVALTMNIQYLSGSFNLPFSIFSKPFQIDIAHK